MSGGYEQAIAANLERTFQRPLETLAEALSAEVGDNGLRFNAFGGVCDLRAGGIRIDGEPETGPRGVVISLYALHAKPGAGVLEPLRAYKEFPGTMPYWGAFRTHTETVLVPHVDRILANREKIQTALDGEPAPAGLGGDGAMVVRPLPKIRLCYVFYRSDEDFPASATCLYAQNADAFIPLDGLADVGEYTSKAIIEIVKAV